MRSRKNKAKKSVKNGGGFRGIKRFSKTPRKSNLWCVETGSTLEDDILEYIVKVKKYSNDYLGYSVPWTFTTMFNRLKNSNQFRSWFGLCNNGEIRTDEEIKEIIKTINADLNKALLLEEQQRQIEKERLKNKYKEDLTRYSSLDENDF
jgi:hypothetical protein